MRNHLLVNARLAADLSQGELAALAGVAVRTVWKAEKGDPIRELQKERIARALRKTRVELWPHVHEPGIAIEEPAVVD